MNKFDSIQLDDQSKKEQTFIKDKFVELDSLIDSLLILGRERSMVHTRLEEAFMWVQKALREKQSARDILNFTFDEVDIIPFKKE